MPTEMTEDERKWNEMKNAMLLAMHEVMLSGEFKEKYYRLYRQYLSEYRQSHGEDILNKYLKENLENE